MKYQRSVSGLGKMDSYYIRSEKVPIYCYNLTLNRREQDTKLNTKIEGPKITQCGSKHKVKSVRFLGIKFDETLNFVSHTNFIVGKIRSTLSMMSRSKHVVPEKLKLNDI